MSICIKPNCPYPLNPDNLLFCQKCGSELLLAGRYRVIRLLGGGGFGKTFEINHSGTLKVLKVLINNDPKAVELFEQEARVLSQLNHPGIPKGYGSFLFFPRDSQTPIYCLVMERIEGMNLEEYLKRLGMRPIDESLAIAWLTQLAQILHEVHSQQFFHRDIKPSNIMLQPDGQLALIDFGTAREVTQTYQLKQAAGQVTGITSAGYTPPEQINYHAVLQSDFFALGRTFVYLLTGKAPTDPAIYDPLNDALRWRDFAPNISPQLADFIESMMARSPCNRPASAEVILQHLGEIERALHPPRSRPQPPQPIPPKLQPANVSHPSPPASSKVSFPGWRFWLLWLLANVLGLGAGLLVGGLIAVALISILRADEIGNLVGVPLMFVVFGIVQLFVLRRLPYRADWWVLATLAGAFAGSIPGGISQNVPLCIVGAPLGATIVLLFLVLGRVSRKSVK